MYICVRVVQKVPGHLQFIQNKDAIFYYILYYSNIENNKVYYINQSNVHCKNGVVVLGLAESDMLHSASGQMVQSRVLSENRYVIFGR